MRTHYNMNSLRLVAHASLIGIAVFGWMLCLAFASGLLNVSMVVLGR